MGNPTNTSTPNAPMVENRRLDSWKEIAAYLKKDVSTVQRWERKEGLPIRRHLHEKQGTVYAFQAEIDAWWNSADQQPLHYEASPATPAEGYDDEIEEEIIPPVPPARWDRLRMDWRRLLVAGIPVLLVIVSVVLFRPASELISHLGWGQTKVRLM